MSYEEENTPGCLYQSQGDHCIPAATASSGWGERADISHIVKIDLLSVKRDLLSLHTYLLLRHRLGGARGPTYRGGRSSSLQSVCAPDSTNS
jgi:hypothetical protein